MEAGTVISTEEYVSWYSVKAGYSPRGNLTVSPQQILLIISCGLTFVVLLLILVLVFIVLIFVNLLVLIFFFEFTIYSAEKRETLLL